MNKITTNDEQVAKLKQLGYEKLNFGCGYFPLEGWTNVDGGDGNVYTPPSLMQVVKLDIFEAFKHIPDNSSKFIFSEQFFEHFDRNVGHNILQEWFRILQPGGVLRIQTPDLEKEVKMYLNILDGISWEDDIKPHRIKNLNNSMESYPKLIQNEEYMPSMILNNGMHCDGHKYLYDFNTLKQSLELAGFSIVKKVEFGISEHSELDGINLHDGGETGRHWIPKIVLEVEAVK